MTDDDRAAWDRKVAITSALRTCEGLFRSPMLTSQASREENEAAITLILIYLHDLLRKADKDGTRIAFTEDVRTAPGVSDVSDLISKCRNVACHNGSDGERLKFENGPDRNFRLFLRIFGKAHGLSTEEHEIANPYEDDVLFAWGSYQLYLRRNAFRAFLLAQEHFKSV